MLTILSLLTLLTLYLLPTIVALLRKKQNIGAVVVINVLLGWSFIGWIVALAMACGAMEGSNPMQTQSVNVYAAPVTQHREQALDPDKPISAQAMPSTLNGEVKHAETHFPAYADSKG